MISPRKCEKLFDEIRAKALACSIAEASVEEIDRLNILQTTLLAMRRAVEGLRLVPQRVLVDGHRLPVLAMPAAAIVRGDAKVAAISAASILAKVYRDQLCLAMHEAHPAYGFAIHKGLPTAEHLAALRQHGRHPEQAVLTESAWALPQLRALARWAPRQVVVADALFEGLSTLESPARQGFVLRLPAAQAIDPGAASVVLDRVQDAGNVGSILRSAAAFGVSQVLALKGTVALWSPKVLRAGMGAHFGLRLVEGLAPDDLAQLTVPMLGTSLATAQWLHHAALPQPCAWVLGHEGQGVAPDLLARCAQVLRIPQPGGEESLNVAAAAAVCLYESMRRSCGTALAPDAA